MECGCFEVCCKGCSCCLEKNTILREREAKINDLERQRLDLLSRNLNIHEGNAVRLANTSQNQIEEIKKLKEENTRLRNQRNYYQNQRNELKQQLSDNEMLSLFEELNNNLNELKEELKDVKEGNKQLKQKTETVNQVIQKTPALKK